jgi:hypothetical protein
MNTHDHIFTPMGDRPTIKILKQGLFYNLLFIAVLCTVAAIIAESSIKILCLYAFLILSIFIIVVKYTTHFIVHIRINTSEKKLFISYVTITGKEDLIVIDISRANYKYGYRINRGKKRWVLILKGKDGELQIYETKSEENRSQKNVFLKTQLDEMNDLILQVRTGI